MALKPQEREPVLRPPWCTICFCQATRVKGNVPYCALHAPKDAKEFERPLFGGGYVCK